MSELGLDTLPVELVYHMMTFLDARDMGLLAQTSTYFHNLIRLELVWQAYCKRDFKLTSLEGWGETATFFDVYSKVLYPYRHCLGMWRDTSNCSGILVHVKLEAGRIIGQFCRHPATGRPRRPGRRLSEDLSYPLKWHPFFSVVLTEGKAQKRCRKTQPVCDNIVLEASEDSFLFRCDSCLDSVKSEDVSSVEGLWRELQIDDTTRIRAQHNLIQMAKFWAEHSLQRLVLPAQSAVSPVTLGLYKGTYGGHGIEIINMVLDPNGYELQGDKILGDTNVPAGKISLYVDLRQPLTLSRELQESREEVEHLEVTTLEHPHCFPPSASQPFCLPPGIMHDTNPLPTRCKARYNAKGRIAQVGFTNPSFSRGHLVVFDHHSFGFYWIDLGCFSMFQLVEDDFSC